MAGLFYYRHLLGDYDTATKDLTLLEHGAYRRLMDGYYANKGPIDARADKLYRVAGAFSPEEQAAVRKVAGMFFDAGDDGFLHNAKCDEEIARVVSESARQSATARARWAKEADLALHHAVASAAAHADASPAADAVAHAIHSQSQNQSQKQGQKAKGKREPPVKPAFTVPSWIDPQAWHDFREMRQRIRKPMTARAQELMVSKLDALRQEGYSVKLVLEASIENSWTNVYPVKSNPAHKVNGGRRSATEQKNDESADDWAGNPNDPKDIH